MYHMQAHDTSLSVRRKNAHGLFARTPVSTQHPLQGNWHFGLSTVVVDFFVPSAFISRLSMVVVMGLRHLSFNFLLSQTRGEVRIITSYIAKQGLT